MVYKELEAHLQKKLTGVKACAIYALIERIIIIACTQVIMGEEKKKEIKIKNISSFAVKFNLKTESQGVTNKKKEVPFLLIPSTATIPANETYEVKIVFQPDHVNNNFFEILLIDIPN
jgi:P pilus assembly chaperone PapD